jgi:hypothetical protein
VRFDASYYRVSLDQDATTSIAPLERRSQFTALLGADYRFAW